MAKQSKLRSFRFRPNTLAALSAAAAEAEVSPNKLAEALLRDALMAWLAECAERPASGRLPSQVPR